MRFLSAALLLALCAAAAGAQSLEGTWLSFSLDRPGAEPQRYSLRVEAGTGRGFYREEAAPAGPGAVADAAEIPITVQAATLRRMFAAVPLVKSGRCDAHNRNIAQTGMKTLRYTTGATVAECTYNYSLDDRVNTATEVFEAVAETLFEGQRLANKLRFDRLGLDAEIDGLQTALNEGRALEIANIVPVLEAIQGDDRVMERVRRKAAHLLEAAGQPVAQPAADCGSSRQ